MAIKSQIRRGTAAQWLAANTVLANGEWGLETDTRLIKIGDGITPWSSLTYITDATYANAIAYAASVANQAYTNSVNYVANGVTNGSIVVANSVYASNAGLLGGSSLTTVQSQITGNAATAYANSVAYINATANAITNSVSNGSVVALNANTSSYLANSTGTLGNIQSWVTGNSATAYTNAVSFANTVANAAYTNAVSYANSAAATAYSNAVSFANTVANTAYTNATVFASNASNINTGTLAEARLPYRMSQNVASNSSVEFVNVYLTGNLTVGSNVNIIGANNYSVTDNMIYLNANATYANPDIGIAAGYNDGTYHHTGIFRDHTNGIWKVFEGYLPEPDASIYIDQTNASFDTAEFMARKIYVGNNSVYGTINTTFFTGTANNADNLGGLSLANVQMQITGNAAAAYANAVANSKSYTDTVISIVNSAVTANASAAYSNATAYTDSKIATANSAITGNAAAAYTNAVATAAADATSKANQAYANATSYTDAAIGTANSAITGNAATAYANAVAYVNTTANAITNSVSNGSLVAFTANNANYLATYTWTAPGAIGSGTANSGAFTTLSASNTTITGTVSFSTAGFSASAWTANGIALVQNAATWTDTTSTGTVADIRINQFGIQTLAASSPITVTNLYGTYFTQPAQGTNVNAPLRYALGADSLRINNQLYVVGTLTGFGGLSLVGPASTTTAQFATAATTAANTKIVNIGTGGLSGSNTYISIGSSVSGANSTIVHYGNSGFNIVPTAASLQVNGDVLFSNSSANVMYIAANGNVGIGTNTPAYKLDITGDFRTSGNIRLVGSLINQSGAMTINQSGGGNMSFKFGAGEYMTIDTSGNTGVGTASPSYKLDVSGAARSYSQLSSPIGIPATPTAAATTTAGSLTAATYYFKVVAVDGLGGLSIVSAESTGAVTTGNTIAIGWTATPGAASYRIYYATTSGAQAAYYTSTANTFTLTATSGTAGSPPSVDQSGKALVGNSTVSVTVGGAIPTINLNPSSANTISITAQSNTTLAMTGSSTGQMLVLTDTTSNTLFMVANSSGATLIAARANNNVDLNPYIGNTVIGAYANTPTLVVGSNTNNSSVIVGGATVNYINTYTTATTSIQIDSYNANTYGSVDYVIQATTGGNYQSTTLKAVSNGSVANSVVLGNITTSGSNLATYTVAMSGNVVVINATPVSSGTTFKLVKTMVGA